MYLEFLLGASLNACSSNWGIETHITTVRHIPRTAIAFPHPFIKVRCKQTVIFVHKQTKGFVNAMQALYFDFPLTPFLIQSCDHFFICRLLSTKVSYKCFLIVSLLKYSEQLIVKNLSTNESSILEESLQCPC